MNNQRKRNLPSKEIIAKDKKLIQTEVIETEWTGEKDFRKRKFKLNKQWFKLHDDSSPLHGTTYAIFYNNIVPVYRQNWLKGRPWGWNLLYS